MICQERASRPDVRPQRTNVSHCVGARFCSGAHQTRCGERDQSMEVHHRNQQPGCDPDRFDRVISGRSCSIRQDPQRLRENRDQPGCGFENSLLESVPSRPTLPATLSAHSHKTLMAGRDGIWRLMAGSLTTHEMSRLQVRHRRRGPGCANTIFNDVARHRAIGIITNCPAPLHRFEKMRTRRRISLSGDPRSLAQAPTAESSSRHNAEAGSDSTAHLLLR